MLEKLKTLPKITIKWILNIKNEKKKSYKKNKEKNEMKMSRLLDIKHATNTKVS